MFGFGHANAGELAVLAFVSLDVKENEGVPWIDGAVVVVAG